VILILRRILFSDVTVVRVSRICRGGPLLLDWHQTLPAERDAAHLIGARSNSRLGADPRREGG